MSLKETDIEALIDLFGASGWDEMRLEIDGAELILSTDSRVAAPQAASAAPLAAPVAMAVPQTASAAAPTATPPQTGASARPAHWVAIKAPNLGTFYRASSPEAAPYVTLGASVTPETEVCLIEVMKLFTTVRAGISGTVREITAQDGAMVEYGTELLWIEPA